MSDNVSNNILCNTDDCMINVPANATLSSFIESFSCTEFKKNLYNTPSTVSFLYSLSFYSPYLTQMMTKYASFLFRLLQDDPIKNIKDCITKIRSANPHNLSEKELRHLLRTYKARVSLGLAILEITGHITSEKACLYLSDFADNCVRLVTNWLFIYHFGVTTMHRNGNSHNSGYFILALGKLGGKELNYSSDIDLVIFYEPEQLALYVDRSISNHTNHTIDHHTYYKKIIKLTRHCVDILEMKDEDGYVFRVDLRLRPDPGATQIVISSHAAMHYYEAQGQNWERSAYIKARPIAGDIKTAQKFLKELYPFIWRKNIDFSVLDDIHSMKKKIHTFKNNTLHDSDNNLLGANIKLFRGGIRDIEFFVSAHQLILGAHNESLRNRATCISLQHLLTLNRISQTCYNQLTKAYWFFRSIEHRIQMVNDLQTHEIPKNPDLALKLAQFCGYNHIEDFFKKIYLHQHNVHNHYQKFFDNVPHSQDATYTDYFFLGDNAEYALSQWFSDNNFHAPQKSALIVQNWLIGRYTCVRHVRSRESLYKVFILILEAFSQSGHPDEALIAFDKFLRHLPGGMQIFSLMRANPNLIQLICLIVSLSSEITQHLSKYPNSLDNLIYNTNPTPEKTYHDYTKQLQDFIQAHKDVLNTYEDILNFLRQYCNQEKCRIAIDFLNCTINALTAANRFAYLAQTICEQMFTFCYTHFKEKYGHIDKSEITIILMGGAGQNTLHFQSDLDIIMVYDCNKQSFAKGSSQLSASAYFMRLTQHFISALNVQTQEGKLYDIDMRLRPSGSAGTLAVHYDSFVSYHQNDAWDWENLTLLKANIIGENSLSHKIRHVIETLTHPPLKDSQQFMHNVTIIRRKIYEMYGSSDVLDVKHSQGGLMDLDFCLSYLKRQYLSLYPDLQKYHMNELIVEMQKKDILTATISEKIRNIIKDFLTIQQIRALTDKCITPHTLSPALQDMIYKSTHTKNMKHLLHTIRKHKLDIEAFCTNIYKDFYSLSAHK